MLVKELKEAIKATGATPKAGATKAELQAQYDAIKQEQEGETMKQEKTNNFNYEQESNKATFERVSYNIIKERIVTSKEQEEEVIYTYETTRTGKAYNLPKQAGGEHGETFARLVQGYIFTKDAERARVAIKRLEKKQNEDENGEPLTGKDLATLEGLRAMVKAIETRAELHRTQNADKVQDAPLAELIACLLTSAKLPQDTNELREALQASYNALHAVALARVAGEATGQADADELQKYTEAKNAIKSILSIYCKESFFYSEFKLSVSNADIVTFYELSLTSFKNNEARYLWTQGKSKSEEVNANDTKALHNELINYMLRKMKAGEAE